MKRQESSNQTAGMAAFLLTALACAGLLWWDWSAAGVDPWAGKLKVRRSIFAARPIVKGAKITPQDLEYRLTRTTEAAGLQSASKIVGRYALEDVPEDTLLTPRRISNAPPRSADEGATAYVRTSCDKAKHLKANDRILLVGESTPKIVPIPVAGTVVSGLRVLDTLPSNATSTGKDLILVVELPKDSVMELAILSKGRWDPVLLNSPAPPPTPRIR